MSQYTWNKESKTPNNFITNSESQPDICRIYVDSEIKKSIKLDELSLPNSTHKVDTKDSQFSTKNMAGISWPIICINDYFVQPEEISNMEIDCTGFIPKISLDLQPHTDELTSKNAPKDGDIISVFIRTSNDIITPLRCDFIITDNRLNGSFTTRFSSQNKMHLVGKLFIPGIDRRHKSYVKTGTSKDAIKDMAKHLGLGFAFNDFDNTNDKQLWLCPNTRISNYINEIIEHSWKDEQSYFKSWIDIYYNLNFINVNKTLLSSDTDLDITAFSSVRDIQNLYPISTDANDVKAVPKIFINDSIIMNSPFYIVSWEPSNKSSRITKSIGSKIKSNAFIHNQNIFNNNDDPYLDIDNVQMYDPKKVDKYIILRGRTTYNPETAGENEMARENYDYDDMYTNSKWMGIQYAISDSDINDLSSTDNWSGNVNKNYYRAVEHNIINKKELDKLYIKLNLNGACLHVLRGEKVPVVIMHNNRMENSVNGNKEDELPVNKMYSGTYFVDGYKIIYKPNLNQRDESGISGFSTEFILKRREWPSPVKI